MWMETTLVTKESSLEDVAALFGDYEGYGMVEEERNGLMTLTFFASLEEGEDLWLAKENWIASVAMKLKEAGFSDILVETKLLEEDSWNSSWKEYVKTMEIIPGLYVEPKWEEGKTPEGADTIIIDTESSFGTGNHETTQCCAKLIALHGKGAKHVLDIGTGTGILLFVAEHLLKGKGEFVGIDLDMKAVEQAVRNGIYNHSKAVFFEGDLDAAYEGVADLIIANLTGDPLKILLPTIIKKLSSHGILIISGIVEDRLSEVLPYIHADYQIVETMKKKNWYTFALRKKHETSICK